MAHIISFSNHKGGVGKTTSAVNVGAGLSYLGKHVLLIDLDPQASLSQSFGIVEADRNIYGALRNDYPITPVNVMKDLDIIPSTLDLSGAEIELSSEAGREYILSEILNPISSKYDFIIIDCPPSLGLLTVNALTASSDVFIPLQAHFLALKGLTKITEVIDKVKKRLNKDLELGGVFVTQFDFRKILHRDVLETITEFFGDKVFKTKIRDNISIAEAPSQGKDVFRYDRKCYGSIDYFELCDEILNYYKKKSKAKNVG